MSAEGQPVAAPPGRKRGARSSSARRQNAIVAAVVLHRVAALAPFALDEGGDIMNNMVLAAAYVVMALGLNIIVGFAGLLDLGYVAFFAIGAYTVGYFGSGYWSNVEQRARASASSSASPPRSCRASTSTS